MPELATAGASQPAPRMRLITLMVATLAMGADAQAGESASGIREAAAMPDQGWRSVLRTEFSYAPPAPAPSDPSTPPAVRESPADPGVVTLPSYVVRETPWDSYRELEQRLRLQPDKGTETAMKKLGTRWHETKLGKVRAGYQTLLYIPIAGGIGW